MPEQPTAVSLTEDQVLYFRARRGPLVGPGAPDAVAAARAILGAQSQQIAPSLHALSLRTAGRPRATQLKERILGAQRDLVRTWGQRETLHVYDASMDWSAVVAARAEWAPGGRRGGMPPKKAVDAAGKFLNAAGTSITRKDLYPVVPRAFLKEVAAIVGTGEVARRFAAGRLLWHLALRGEACVAEKIGAEQAYASRRLWFPALRWAKRTVTPRAAATALARRYFAVHGPATVQDLAHFFGARMPQARGWLEALRDESSLTPVRCGDRKGLFALVEDLQELTARPPRGIRAWPPRLLPLWDTMLMGHADKSWVAAGEAEKKQIWRKAAMVAAVVLDRGRAVATWTHVVKSTRQPRLEIRIEPMGGWRVSRHTAPVRREAQELARHLDLVDVDLEVRATK